ncbi:hypothetical protein DD238_005619 [Peronospora effusa]|uniref:Alcohol dehydrogenase-like N-terminal domain-containing protein n=1 Tax=Peronospora effusa TaxID=542832 RepID=A0A3M6VS07_9STRA|nr:hypothetical protein DD238_005619 [Peronospora effusa]
MSAADGTSNIKNKNSHCGICGSDLHTIESVGDLWTCPCVVGHEIVGEVTLAGPDVKIRNCVGVEGPLGSMQRILSGDHAYCTHRVLTYNDKYKKNGATSDRGHPDYVRVAHEDAFKILDNIPFDGAAPLLCDDTTDSVKPDKRVGVEDVNGLGHKFAHAMGVDAVMALFSLTKKEQKMADSGATEFVVDRKKKQAATVIGLTDVLRSSYAKIQNVLYWSDQMGALLQYQTDSSRAPTKRRCQITPFLNLRSTHYSTDGTSNIKNKNAHCGTCGSDLHTIESVGDFWTCPCVVGLEIVGEVTLAGPDVKVGDRVGVGVGNLAWSCLKKDPSVPSNGCLSGDDALCAHRVFTYNDKYKKNGETSHGGHPDYVRVAHEDAFKILDNIPSDGAAPLLCADTTVLISLKEDSVKLDKRVGVEDVNGLGHKFAHAMGVDAVMAFFSLTKKEQKMADSGATEFVSDRNKKQAATVIGLTDVLRSSYAKVLTAIALLTCVASRVATSAWIPQDVMRSSRALKAAHTPVQANRNLRLNAAKSDHTFNFEERMLPLRVMGQPVAMELSQSEAAALQKLSDLYAGNAHEAVGKIVGGISQRVEGVTNLEQKEVVYNSLIKLFLNPGDDYKLARLLDAEAKIKEMTAFAENVQAAQVRYWHSQGKSAADVFDILQLGTAKEKLFKNPLFHRLIDFIMLTTPDKKTSSVLPTLYSTLSSRFNDEVLAKTLVEGANTAGKDSVAPKLLLMRLLKGQLDGESKRTVLNLAKLNTGSQRMNGPLKVTFRKFSGFFTRIDSQWNDLTQLKEMFGESKTAEMFATTNEKSSVVTRAERLLHKQFSLWLDDEILPRTLEGKLSRDGVSEDVVKKIKEEYVNYWATPMAHSANL